MQIQLSDHFTVRKLLRFTVPTIIMMVFTSIYSVVDGFFVSNFVGKTSFAAVNLIMPFLIILGSFGFMFGTGGCALVAKTLGEGNRKQANRIFSMIIYVSIFCGIVLSILGIIFIRPIASLLGAEGQLLEDCVKYGRVILIVLPAYMLQLEFQSFLITAEKPKIGLFVTVLSGVANMVLDAVFVILLPKEYKLIGAASATAISQTIGGFIPFIYFIKQNSSLLKLSAPSKDKKALLKTVTNGSSELMSNISMSVVGILYNIQLFKYAGENGIASYGTMMYVSMIFISIFIGYSIGVSPVIGYHFGAQNHRELRSLLYKSLCIISVFSVCMLFSGIALSSPLSEFFVGYDRELYDMTVHGFFIFSFSFLFAGFAIFGSSFFTSLNDGLVSAAISFLRTLIFQLSAIIVLPLIFELEGIWYSIIIAEAMAVITVLIFLLVKRKKYHY